MFGQMDMEELKKKMVQRSGGLSLSQSKIAPLPPSQSSKPKLSNSGNDGNEMNLSDLPPPPMDSDDSNASDQRKMPKGPLPPHTFDNSFDNFQSAPPRSPSTARMMSTQISRSVIDNSFKQQSSASPESVPRSPGMGRIMSTQVSKSAIENSFKQQAAAAAYPIPPRLVSDSKPPLKTPPKVRKEAPQNNSVPNDLFAPEVEPATESTVSFGLFSLGLQKIFGGDDSVEYCFTSSRDHSVFIKGSSDVHPMGDLCFLPIYLFALEQLKPERISSITTVDFYDKEQRYLPSQNGGNPLSPGGASSLLAEMMNKKDSDSDLLEKILDKMSDASGSRISCSLPYFFELEDSELHSKLSALVHLLKAKGNNMENARVKNVVNLLLSLYSMEWSLSAASTFAATLSNFGTNPATLKQCYNTTNVQRAKHTILRVGELGNGAALHGIYSEGNLIIIIPREGGISVRSKQLSLSKSQDYLNKIAEEWPQFKIRA